MNRRKLISKIAKDYLNIETLREKKRDSLDFHDCSVWSIKKALEKAYETGRKSKESYA